MFEQGFLIQSFPLPSEIKKLVQEKNWIKIDAHFKSLTLPNGELFAFLKKFKDFSSIEFIISHRYSDNPDEEDGIWHDDGSRLFAFSLSLNLQLPIGGELSFRKKEKEEIKISTPPWGEIIIFLTGHDGYEHKTNKVIHGERTMIAGWCS